MGAWRNVSVLKSHATPRYATQCSAIMWADGVARTWPRESSATVAALRQGAVGDMTVSMFAELGRPREA